MVQQNKSQELYANGGCKSYRNPKLLTITKVFWPSQMRATVEDRFKTRKTMAAATAFLWEHESHMSWKRRTQNLAAIGF